MNKVSVIDISTFIWSENNFKKEPHQYYKISKNAIELFDLIEKSKSLILIRKNLQAEIFNNFPYSKVPYQISYFEERALNFLASLGGRMIGYANDEEGIKSLPNIVKEHFNSNVQNEVKYLLCEMHKNTSFEKVFFTFSYFWESEEEELHTVLEEETISHKTIISDEQERLNNYFNSQKPLFDHNPKHDRNKPGTFESPLTCYDGANHEAPQGILENSYRVGKRYYGYDEINKVYVVFYNHKDNLFHGHDLININDVPFEVQKHFNKK